MGRGSVIHVLGLEFDEEHNGEVRFQISLFLKKLQAFTGSMPTVKSGAQCGPLLCQASVQSIHPVDILIRVMNNWVDRLHRCLAQKGPTLSTLFNGKHGTCKCL
jgi:predicted secreted protein